MMKMQATFFKLKQGDKSVEEYDLEFNRLVRFSLVYVSTEELKVKRFIAGLRNELKGHVAAHTSSDYVEALRVVILIDKLQWGSAQSSHTTVQGKRTDRSHPRTSGPPRDHTNKRGKASMQNRTNCPNCRRPHSRECRVGIDACYKCGQTGHLAIDCP